MRDNHLHTNFSYDCQTDFEAYLEQWSGEFVTTEHLDLSNPYLGGPRDDIPDYQAYCQKIAQLEQSYGSAIKKGIEIGYFAPRKADILAYLEGKEFDLKLLSVHHNGVFDYLEEAVFDLKKEEVIPLYLKELTAAVGEIPAHVLAHFDYGFRKFQVSLSDLQAFELELRQLFSKMIEYDLALELNSKSMYLYGHEEIYRYVAQLFLSMGGHKFSVGSDGHVPQHFRLHFDKIQKLLNQLGIAEEDLI